MGAAKGNKNALGNRGGGRIAVKEELWHLDKWENDSLVRKLEEKVTTGVYAIRDIWLLKALKGDGTILKQAADKVLADLQEHSGSIVFQKEPEPEQVDRFLKRHANTGSTGS